MSGSWLVFLVAAFLVSVCKGDIKPPQIIQPVNKNDPTKLAKNVTKTVLVIGGGLAGLSAATDLAERGFKVTIREASGQVGGPLIGDSVTVGKQKFIVDRSYLDWFSNDYQFEELLKRLNVSAKNILQWKKIDYRYKSVYKPEEFYCDGKYPFSVWSLFKRSANLGFTQYWENRKFASRMFHFNYNTNYKNMDKMTAYQWYQKSGEVTKVMYDVMIRPIIMENGLNETQVSAAEVMTLYFLYYLSEKDCQQRNIPIVNVDKLILEPWLQHLKKLNVTIETNTTVVALMLNDARTKAIGDFVHPNDNFDHVVISASLQGTQKLLDGTYRAYSGDPRVSAQLERMSSMMGRISTGDPYQVLRVWIRGQFSSIKYPPIFFTSGYGPIVKVAQVHVLEKTDYSKWSKTNNASVMEFKLFPEVNQKSAANVWKNISSLAASIIPELKNMTLLQAHLTTNAVPGRFAGEAKIRQNVTSINGIGITNVFLAGKWLQTSYPSMMLSRSMTTGREAANQILLAEKVRQIPVTVPPSEGPGYLLRKKQLKYSRLHHANQQETWSKFDRL